MSHIPSSAMPHAGPAHHDEPAKATSATKPAASSADTGRVRGWPLAAIALGGVLALGAVALAVPLLRAPAAPSRKGPKAKGKRKAHS